MAVAAPRRRASPAPPPSRTTPPKRKAPARKPTSARATAAPAKAPGRTAPARRTPARRSPTRPAPQRSKAARLQAGGQLIPIAVGRTAVAVRQLPDSGLVVRMTRGRAWIAVLGVLLVGIVALNVVTLSFAASSGKIDEQITTLEKENSMLGARVAEKYGTGRVRNEAKEQGMIMADTDEPTLLKAGPGDVAAAAERLAVGG
jgi:hypothetical protein